MRFSAFCGLNLRTNECVFHSRDCSFQSVTQSIPTSNEQMKTKWHTLAGKQILHKPIGKLVKNGWNIAFTWLKQRKTSGPSWKHVSFRFFDKFFVYNVIQTSCFFFLEKKELTSISKKAKVFRRLTQCLLIRLVSLYEDHYSWNYCNSISTIVILLRHLYIP